jgi:hypothetical protein
VHDRHVDCFTVLGKSLICSMKKKGLWLEHWSTPEFTVCEDDLLWQYVTCCFLCLRHGAVVFSNCDERLKNESLLIMWVINFIRRFCMFYVNDIDMCMVVKCFKYFLNRIYQMCCCWLAFVHRMCCNTSTGADNCSRSVVFSFTANGTDTS